jgi:hypothetical protein
MWVAGSQSFMQSAIVSFAGFLPVRVGTVGVAPEPDEVCELGGIGRVGPVELSPDGWPSDVDAGGDEAVPCVPDDVEGVPVVLLSVPVPVALVAAEGVPPEVAEPVTARPLGVPVVDGVEPCVGGKRREGGKISEFEREGVTGPLGVG